MDTNEFKQNGMREKLENQVNIGLRGVRPVKVDNVGMMDHFECLDFVL